MELLRFFKHVTVTYWGDCWFAIFFVVALIGLFFLEKDQLKKIPFFWFAAVALVFIYNPITYWACKRFFYADNFIGYYLKLYNIVPVFIILVYGLVVLLNKLKGWAKFAAVGVLCGIIIFCGTTIQRQPWFTQGANREKIPTVVKELEEVFAEQLKEADAITSAVPADQGVHVMAPTDIAVYMRQYENRYFMPFTRVDEDGVGVELTLEKPDIDKIYQYMISTNVDYVVAVSDDLDKDEHFEKFADVTGFHVYKVTAPKWVVTCYKDYSGNQGMCYLIRNTLDNTMVVIDGGSRANGKGLHEDIMLYGGVVDAWIVTHYHSDHVGAFNYIFENYKDLTVKTVYDSPLDMDYFREVAHEWDEMDYFEEYLSITSGWDNVHHVTRGEQVAVQDLKIKFLNTYDELSVENTGGDIANDCALVVKVRTDKNSMLFMSDCHSEDMGLMLMDQFGDELDVDILQCAHHGNNSIPEATGFYEMVKPKIAVFDAPEWLMTGEKYSADDLAKYLEEEKVSVHWWDRNRHGYGF